MTKLLEQAVEAARALPPESQDDIARIVLRLAGNEEPPVVLSDEERAANCPRSASVRARAIVVVVTDFLGSGGAKLLHLRAEGSGRRSRLAHSRISFVTPVEMESHRNIEVIWLLRSLKPDFKTIADFRRDNRAAFRSVFRAFVLHCRHRRLALRHGVSKQSADTSSRKPRWDRAVRERRAARPART
jgi:hypothetical protein